MTLSLQLSFITYMSAISTARSLCVYVAWGLLGFLIWGSVSFNKFGKFSPLLLWMLLPPHSISSSQNVIQVYKLQLYFPFLKYMLCLLLSAQIFNFLFYLFKCIKLFNFFFLQYLKKSLWIYYHPPSINCFSLITPSPWFHVMSNSCSFSLELYLVEKYLMPDLSWILPDVTWISLYQCLGCRGRRRRSLTKPGPL